MNTRGMTPKPTGPAIGPEPLENGALKGTAGVYGSTAGWLGRVVVEQEF